MKIISWNLLHRAGAGLDQVRRLISEEAPDLLLLQEATDIVDLLPDYMGGHYVRNALPGRRHGLAVWSRQFFAQPPATITLPSGLIVRRVCQIILFADFGIANVHLSHGQMLNRRQLRQIATRLPARAAILGDCNMVGPSLLPGFKDVGPRHATHAAATLVPLRLDRCLVRNLACEDATILNRGNSDHRPIAVHLSKIA